MDTDWQPVYDEASSSWYFWNTKTSETTWTNPLKVSPNQLELPTPDPAPGPTATPTATPTAGQDVKGVVEHDGSAPAPQPALADNAPAETPPAADAQDHSVEADEYYQSKEYYDWYVATCGQPGGQPEAPLHVLQDTVYQHMQQMARIPMAPGTQVDYSKATAQMSYFFDTEKYQRERAIEILAGKPVKKYTKKQLQQFKKKNKEKKIKSLVQRMGPG